MITQLMTAEAEAAAARYKTLIEGWRSLFINSLDRSTFASAASVRALVEQAYDMARAYSASERELIEQRTQEFALEAHRVTARALSVDASSELPGDVSEHLREIERYLSREIAIQIERDIAFLRQSYQRVVLQVHLAARSQNISSRTALMQYRIGNAVELNFFFHDRRNQRWPSQKFVRAIWRQHLLAAYNETVLVELADHGLRVAEIAHSDPKSEVHGMRLALSPNTPLPTYAELRNDVFHPNAEAILIVPESA